MSYKTSRQSRSLRAMASLAILAVGGATAHLHAAPQDITQQPGYMKSEFIYEKAPFASCHASTIVETKNGLVAAWFGGTVEGAIDVGIWLSRHVAGKWTAPVEVATGEEENKPRQPTWNPVLFQPKTGPLLLFYKAGPDPRHWWGMLKTSSDNGQTWSAARRLTNGILGPIKNKPVQLENGDLLCPSSTEKPITKDWRLRFERTGDNGETWKSAAPAPNPGAKEFDAIQPSILQHPGGKLQAVGRTHDKKIFETWSEDNGQTWTPVTLTDLPNPNSGTDAMTLRDGRHLLVYNHVSRGRSPLNVSLSRDGNTWEAAYVLETEPGEYSYPAVIQTADSLLHITYTWKRERVKHVILDPSKLKTQPITAGAWPKATN